MSKFTQVHFELFKRNPCDLWGLPASGHPKSVPVLTEDRPWLDRWMKY